MEDGRSFFSDFSSFSFFPSSFVFWSVEDDTKDGRDVSGQQRGGRTQFFFSLCIFRVFFTNSFFGRSRMSEPFPENWGELPEVSDIFGQSSEVCELER